MSRSRRDAKRRDAKRRQAKRSLIPFLWKSHLHFAFVFYFKFLFVFHFCGYFPVWRRSWSVEDSTLLLRVKKHNLGTRQERFRARTTRPQVGPEPHSGGPLWRGKLLFIFSYFFKIFCVFAKVGGAATFGAKKHKEHVQTPSRIIRFLTG